jgi:predicted SprT family Zn-dependent metalloprotease
MYNNPMLITEQYLNKLAETLWAEYCEVFPKLVKFDCPKIILNSRLSSTAGRCFASQNYIDLATKLFTRNRDAMLREILPHEIAHQIDYNLNGEPNGKWHRESWKIVMVKIGQSPTRCHNLTV